MAFNPNEHMMQLKSKEGAKDYLPVQYRLVWFRELCPEGTIETEEVLVDLDREMEEEVFVWNAEKRRSEKVVKRAKGYARFKATITDGKGGKATGTKSECAASFPDYIEKAETGAIGRALAVLGYGTAFAPELNEEHRIVDSPIDRSTEDATRTPPQPSSNGKAPTAVPVAKTTPAQLQVKPGDVEECKAFVGKVFTFKQENYEARWGGYKVHVLNRPVADPDLTPADLAQLREYANKENEKKAAASTSGK